MMRIKVNNAKCQTCNTYFESIGNRLRKFCSKMCASILRKSQKKIVTCIECNKNYEVLPCRINKTKFCSRICFKNGSHKIRKYTPKGEAIIISKTCEKCSKKFDHKLSRKNIARFCSKECIKQNKGHTICFQCNNEYEYIPRNRHNSLKFCSKSCFGQFNQENSFWKIATDQEINNYLKNLFEIKVKKLENGCWEWLGGRYKAGYGGTTFKGKPIKVHRLSYMYHFNDWDIPSSTLICHRCDQVWCCAPRHLFKGTARDNCHDMIAKNRQNWQKGEKSSNAKMSENTAIEVIKMLNQKIKMTEIAKKLNIGKASVNSIKRKKSWKHVTLEDQC